MGNEIMKNGEILLYSYEGSKTYVDVYFQDETFWLTQAGMAELFDVNVPAISKHLKNIFDEEELDRNATVSKKETVEKKTTKSKSVDDLKSLADEKKEVAAVRYGITNCDNLRLRTAPNTDSEIIKMLQKGTQVEILGDANQDFYKVSGGYLMKRFVDIHEK